jgi:exosortase N
MILSLTPAIRRNENFLFLVLLVTGIGGGILCFSFSYLYHTNVLLGFILFPFSLQVSGERRSNYFYLLLMVLLATIGLSYGIRIAYFFTLALFVIWLIEHFYGRCSTLVLFLLFFMSPFFTQVTTILGFPLRLQLSQLAGLALSFTNFDVQVQGNNIIVDGAGFSVNDACMGLNMLSMSMLISTFMLARGLRSASRNLAFRYLVMFFFLVFSLNVVANLFRIIILVVFRIPAGQYLHEGVGILCFIFYIVVPVYFISAWLITRLGVEKSSSAPLVGLTAPRKAMLTLVALAVLSAGALIGMRKDTFGGYATVSYPGGKVETLKDGITKVSTEQLLIYVKPIPEFFSGEHTPLLCWKGSGYTLSSIKEDVIEGRKIYIGNLTRGKDVLTTAWWYANGRIETISQAEWRIRMLKGEPRFSVVNITAANEHTLKAHLSIIIRNNKLNIQ